MKASLIKFINIILNNYKFTIGRTNMYASVIQNEIFSWKVIYWFKHIYLLKQTKYLFDWNKIQSVIYK